MANVILVHTGPDPVPEHIYTCIRQIRDTNKYAKIHVITDNHMYLSRHENFVYHGLIDHVHDIVKDGYVSAQELQRTPFFKDDPNPLWRTSALRFAYIQECMIRYNLTDVFHFDNDVLVYTDLDIIASTTRLFGVNKVLITKHSPTEAVCGMMYIPDQHAMMSLMTCFLEYIVKTKNVLERELGSMPHEMRILGDISNKHPDVLGTLPVLPTDEDFSKYGLVFDPSSYGQFLGGTHARNGEDYLTISPERAQRTIDKEILNGNIKPSFINRRPVIKYSNDKTAYIANLHIHSKKLHVYV